MNSALQALVNTPLFLEQVLCSNKGRFMLSLREVFLNMKCFGLKCYSPETFLNLSVPQNWNVDQRSQQDCHEYIMHLLDTLQVEDKSSTTVINSVFGGIFSMKIKCVVCCN